MSLRTVALDTPRLCRSTNVFDPIGSLVETKSATIARRTSRRRSSACPIQSTSNFTPLYGGQLRLSALSVMASDVCREGDYPSRPWRRSCRLISHDFQGGSPRPALPPPQKQPRTHVAPCPSHD